jgi:hypothetical protein
MAGLGPARLSSRTRRRVAQGLAQPLLPFLRERRLEHATFERRHSRGRTFSAVTFCTSRNKADEFGLIVLPSCLMKSSGMP